MSKLYPALATILVLYHISAQAQPATSNAASKSQVIGQVTSVDAPARHIAMQDDHGASIAVSVAESVPVLRVPPGETDLKKAARIAFTDIGAGDRVLAVGTRSDDGKELQARTLVVMSKSDLAQKQQREQQDWRTRGIAGTVTAIDPAGRTLTVKVGQQTLAVQTGNQTEYRRYTPNSVKFRDSVASSLSELKPGDQIRVLGDKTEDGLGIKAERVVSGSFRQIAGTILSINAEAGEIRINDLATKKPVIISINSSSVMKKLSPDIAAALSRRFRPAGTADSPAPRGGGRDDLGQMLDRMPAAALTDLKTGDAVMVSGSAGNDSSRLTAITLLAGVEPLLTASPDATRDIMAGWNFGGDSAPE